MNNEKYIVTGPETLNKRFCESYVLNKANVIDDLEKQFKEFKFALNVLPESKSYILAEDYQGLSAYMQNVLEYMKGTTDVDAIVKTGQVYDEKLELHMRSEPMNKQGGAYMVWREELGRIRESAKSSAATFGEPKRKLIATEKNSEQ